MVRCISVWAAFAALVASYSPSIAGEQDDLPWNGGYFGLQGGQNLRARESGTLGFDDPAFPGVTAANLFANTSRDIDLKRSPLAGFVVGWNWQSGVLVGGVEADMSYVNATGATSAFTATDPLCAGPCTWQITTDWHSIGTLRGRAGLALGPVLLYGTAGAAWAIVRTSNQIPCTGPCSANPLATGTANDSHTGFAYGAGIEWMIVPHIVLRADYIAANLGAVTHTFTGQVTNPSPPPATLPYQSDSFNHDLTFSAARGAIIFKF